MSRPDVKAVVNVLQDGESAWGESNEEIVLRSWWNDDRGEFVEIEADGKRYCVSAAALRIALDVVTHR